MWVRDQTRCVRTYDSMGRLRLQELRNTPPPQLQRETVLDSVLELLKSAVVMMEIFIGIFISVPLLCLFLLIKFNISLKCSLEAIWGSMKDSWICG